MTDAQPFRDIIITPSYSRGFTFSWDIHPSFTCNGPWTFQLEEAETQEGPWDPISPVLVNKYNWSDAGPRVAPKDPSLYFRIHMRAEGRDYWSYVAMPYSSLGRREFLIARDIIRRELLQQRKLSGVECVVWRKSIFGPRCTECNDFVTDEPTSGTCKACFGTGRNPGYHGPYPLWVTFTPEQRDTRMDNDQTAVHEDYAYSGRVVGTLRLKNDDVIVDTKSDLRYFVDVVQNLVELRRYPLVQDVRLNQIAVTHPIFELGVVDAK